MSSAYVPAELRRRVATQARMEIEHILPRARGGLTAEENLWLACSACNNYKGDRVNAQDPKTDLRARLFNPRFQVWEEHFAWNVAGTRILGRTPTGRATIVALKLNRPLLVRARTGWVTAGWHPSR